MRNFFLLALVLGVSLAKEDEHNCAKYTECLSCVRYGCTFYSNLESGLCTTRSIDNRLFMLKVRTPSACFRVGFNHIHETTKFTPIKQSEKKTITDYASPHEKNGKKVPPPVLLPLSSHPENEGKGSSIPPSNSTSIDATVKVANRQKKDQDISKGNPSLTQPTSLRDLNCRQYALIVKPISKKERSEDRLYKHCMRKLQS